MVVDSKEILDTKIAVLGILGLSLLCHEPLTYGTSDGQLAVGFSYHPLHLLPSSLYDVRDRFLGGYFAQKLR